MARPKKEVDEETVKKLAAINCSLEEMGHILGVSHDTIERRFASVIKEGRSQGKMSLKRKMYDTAMSGNSTMMIWLSKNMLGYSDRVENTNIDLSKEDSAKLKEEAKQLLGELE